MCKKRRQTLEALNMKMNQLNSNKMLSKLETNTLKYFIEKQYENMKLYVETQFRRSDMPRKDTIFNKIDETNMLQKQDDLNDGL